MPIEKRTVVQILDKIESDDPEDLVDYDGENFLYASLDVEVGINQFWLDDTKDGMQFFLGPAVKYEGVDNMSLSDYFSCYSWMKEKLTPVAERHNVEFSIGDSENSHHMIGQGLTIEKVNTVWQDVLETLRETVEVQEFNN